MSKSVWSAILLSLVVDGALLLFWWHLYADPQNNEVARQWIRLLAIATLLVAQLALLLVFGLIHLIRKARR